VGEGDVVVDDGGRVGGEEVVGGASELRDGGRSCSVGDALQALKDVHLVAYLGVDVQGLVGAGDVAEVDEAEADVSRATGGDGGCNTCVAVHTLCLGVVEAVTGVFEVFLGDGLLGSGGLSALVDGDVNRSRRSSCGKRVGVFDDSVRVAVGPPNRCTVLCRGAVIECPQTLLGHSCDAAGVIRYNDCHTGAADLVGLEAGVLRKFGILDGTGGRADVDYVHADGGHAGTRAAALDGDLHAGLLGHVGLGEEFGGGLYGGRTGDQDLGRGGAGNVSGVHLFGYIRAEGTHEGTDGDRTDDGDHDQDEGRDDRRDRAFIHVLEIHFHFSFFS